MSDNKKYYYMRVKENFYESEDMVILQSMDNGYLYSDILMKLYLRSLKHDGRLMFKEHIPYNPKMIATITGHNIDVVEKSLKIFKELNLIDVLDNGAIYMLDMQNFIGETSTEADRIKAYRKKIKEETILLGSKDVQMYDECTPKIELKLEQELEKEKDISIPYSEIIDYLNLKANTKYKSSGKKTKDLIKARFNDKYTLEDFKIVIDKKCSEWLDTSFENYLRPETLFSNKFEGYLNQKEVKGGQFNKPATTNKKFNIKREEFDPSKYDTSQGDMPV